MERKIFGQTISYEKQGAGEPLLLLHGWGLNKETFASLSRALQEDYLVYTIDLPPFGQSTMEVSYSLDDYVKIIKEFIILEEITNPHILGHSFGGRIAIRYAINNKVSSLILISSAGIRPKLSLYKRFKIGIYKKAKKWGIKLKSGSADYQKTKGITRETFVKIINTDQTDELKNIIAPTLLIWGKKDKQTPLKMGKIMKEQIANSALVCIDACGHFPYIEKYRYTLIVIKAFLRGCKL